MRTRRSCLRRSPLPVGGLYRRLALTLLVIHSAAVRDRASVETLVMWETSGIYGDGLRSPEPRSPFACAALRCDAMPMPFPCRVVASVQVVQQIASGMRLCSNFAPVAMCSCRRKRPVHGTSGLGLPNELCRGSKMMESGVWRARFSHRGFCIGAFASGFFASGVFASGFVASGLLHRVFFGVAGVLVCVRCICSITLCNICDALSRSYLGNPNPDVT